MCPHDTTKRCRKCGETKPLSDYTIDVRYKDGRYPWCAECRRAWRQGRKDRQRELHAQWVEQNRDHVHDLANAHYARHKERYSAKRRIYDRERWRTDPAYRARKRDQDRERYHKPETHERKRAAAHRKYQKAKHDPVFRQKRSIRSRIDKQRRRARLALAESTLTLQEWRAILSEQNHRCAACQRHFSSLLRPTLDHIVPVSKGGGTTKANSQALCQPCNSKKYTKTIDYRPLVQSSFLDGDDDEPPPSKSDTYSP